MSARFRLLIAAAFAASEPDRVETTVATPPRQSGSIDLADFDPERWRGRRRR